MQLSQLSTIPKKKKNFFEIQNYFLVNLANLKTHVFVH